MEDQSGRASASLGLFLNAMNLRSIFMGTLAVTILLCGAESLSSQESKLRVNQGSGLRGVEPAARNSVPNHWRWLPFDVDETLPPVDIGTPCLLPQVLTVAAQRVKELVTNLQQFTATEWLEHEQVDGSGNVGRKETRTFTYLAGIEQIRPGMLSVDEYRNGATSLDAFPVHLATTGLAALALIFHPYYVDDFEMSCEGLGQSRGQPAWQVHFRQRNDRPSRIRSYRVKHVGYPVKLKGRAWIGADTHQVVRLETDLAEEIPAIRLRTEHLTIEYRPVQFRKRRVELWLPESADLYFDFKGHRYHRRHSFSDFRLFAVDVDQTIHPPGEP